MKKVFFVITLGLLVFSNIAFASEYIGTLSAGGDVNGDSFPTPTFNGANNAQASQTPSTQFASLSSAWNNFGQSLFWPILAAAAVIGLFLLIFLQISKRKTPTQ